MQATEITRSDLRPRRRWFRYSLRTLLALVTVACVVLGLWVQRAERQRRAVAAIESLGGEVYYEHDGSFSGWPPLSWLRALGHDYVANVDEVYLNNTLVSDAGLEHLRVLSHLRRLNLEHTQISDVGLAHLKRLTELRELFLYDTQVSDAGLEHLKGMTGLEGLWLDNPNISDAGLSYLKGLTGLRELDLFNTRVTDAGVAELRAALPDCNIVCFVDAESPGNE